MEHGDSECILVLELLTHKSQRAFTCA
jgi:hypothetical protein